MVYRFSILMFLLLFPAFAFAPGMADIMVQWDPMPTDQQWTEVRIYERTGNTMPYTYALVCTNSTPAKTQNCTIQNVAAGTHTYIARSFDGQNESVDSNAATGIIVARPAAPTNVTITINIH